MKHPAETDALRLLRCINDTQAQGRHGARVDPPQAAQEIGLEVGSESYHDALRYLAEEGALVGDEHTEMHTEEVEGPQPHSYALYLFTERAMVLLKEQEDWRKTSLRMARIDTVLKAGQVRKHLQEQVVHQPRPNKGGPLEEVIYKLLRLGIRFRPDWPLEITGVFAQVAEVEEKGSSNSKPSPLSV